MAVVLDANILIVLVSGDARRAAAEAKLRQWLHTGEELHAPMLALYEVANGLTRLVAAGGFPRDGISEAWAMILSLPLTYHALTDGDDVVRMALRLGRASAYDASYLTLAQDLDAELWTFDGPLARNASGLDFSVHLLQ